MNGPCADAQKNAENAKNLLTTGLPSVRISMLFSIAYGGIAQLARAFGSYPKCPRFESRCRYHKGTCICAFFRPVGQVVKTPPFHGGNMGSSPVRVTKANKSEPYLPGWRWVRILLYFRAISDKKGITFSTGTDHLLAIVKDYIYTVIE